MVIKAGQSVRQWISGSETKDGVPALRRGQVARTILQGAYALVRWDADSSWESSDSLEASNA